MADDKRDDFKISLRYFKKKKNNKPKIEEKNYILYRAFRKYIAIAIFLDFVRLVYQYYWNKKKNWFSRVRLDASNDTRVKR